MKKTVKIFWRQALPEEAGKPVSDKIEICGCAGYAFMETIPSVTVSLSHPSKDGEPLTEIQKKIIDFLNKKAKIKTVTFNSNRIVFEGRHDVNWEEFKKVAEKELIALLPIEFNNSIFNSKSDTLKLKKKIIQIV